MDEATVTKKCRHCGEHRPLEDFYPKVLPSGYGPASHKCRYCVRIYTQARVAKAKTYAQQVKLEAGCADCGLKSPYPEVYDFDHRPGVVKVNDISRLYLGPMSILVAEVLKCDVVCSNCHRIRTFTRKLDSGNGTFGVDRPRRRQPDPIPDDVPPMLDFDWPA